MVHSLRHSFSGDYHTKIEENKTGDRDSRSSATVQRLQNRVARIMTGNFDYNIPGLRIVKELGWLNVYERKIYLTSLLMYKCVNGIAPNYLSDRLVFADEIHEHHTRQVSDNAIYVPHAQTQYFQRSFAIRGPVLWNSLPRHVTEAPSVASFKSQLKIRSL